MPTKSYLWGMGVAGIFTLAAFLLVLFYFDPTITGGVGVGLFFISLIASLVLWLTLGIYLVRAKLQGESAELFAICLRHSGLVTFIISGILILQALRVLHWWNIILVILAALMVETYARIKVE